MLSVPPLDAADDPPLLPLLEPELPPHPAATSAIATGNHKSRRIQPSPFRSAMERQRYVIGIV
jgi:hypothetical protein